MNPSKHFPLVITDKLAETKAYYTAKLGCSITFDLDAYLQVRFGEDPDAPELAFASPGSMGAKNGDSEHGRFGGDGLILSVPTKDADAPCERLRGAGAEIGSEPSDKPWGWRSFAVRDPNGVWLDFFHEAPQTAGADAAG